MGRSEEEFWSSSLQKVRKLIEIYTDKVIRESKALSENNEPQLIKSLKDIKELK